MNSIYDSRILNLVIFFPLLVAGLIALLPKGEKGQIRAVTFAGMLGSLLTTVWAWLRFEAKSPVEYQLVGGLDIAGVRVGAVTEDDVAAAEEGAECGDRAAGLGQGAALGGTAVQEEAVDQIPVEIAAGFGGEFGEGARPVGHVQPAEDLDARVPQASGGLQTVAVGAGAGAVGDIEGDPVQRGGGAGEFAPFQWSDEGVGIAGDTDAQA